MQRDPLAPSWSDSLGRRLRLFWRRPRPSASFPPRPPKRVSSWVRLGRALGRGLGRVCLVAAALLLISALGLGWYGYELGLHHPVENQLRPILSWHPTGPSLIYDRSGALVKKLYSRDQSFIAFADLPEDLVKAIVAVEDRDFWQHHGIAPRALLRALWIFGKEGGQSFSQGGSTITQQLVRAFLLPREKTIHRKAKELFLAWQLDARLSKVAQFEIYANALFLGQGSYGLAAAAQRYFARDLRSLGLSELALLAGLFQAPSAYNPLRYPLRAKRRQGQVLQAMVASALLEPERARALGAQALVFASSSARAGVKKASSRAEGTAAGDENLGYFVDYIAAEAAALLGLASLKNRALRVDTSLDPSLQQALNQALQQSAGTLKQGELRARGVPLEVAALVTDPVRGEISAMLGGRSYRRSQFNRAVQAQRQPGSLFKPAVFALALERGYRWSDVSYVTPIAFGKNYRPHNSEADYLKSTTLLRALYRSMNSPVLELGNKLGLKEILTFAQKLGLRSPLREEFGTLLGASEASLFDLARMYGVFAAQGRLVELTGIRRISDASGKVLYQAPTISKRSSQVLTPELAFMLVQGLQEVLRRGTAREARELVPWAAGKTGTSDEGKDNWFAGFSAQHVAIVWAGNDQGLALGPLALGSTLALPIWQRFFAQVFVHTPPQPFVEPPGLEQIPVHPLEGYPSNTLGIPMWFIQGAGPRAAKANAAPKASFRDPFGD